MCLIIVVVLLLYLVKVVAVTQGRRETPVRGGRCILMNIDTKTKDGDIKSEKVL